MCKNNRNLNEKLKKLSVLNKLVKKIKIKLKASTIKKLIFQWIVIDFKYTIQTSEKNLREKDLKI